MLPICLAALETCGNSAGEADLPAGMLWSAAEAETKHGREELGV